MIVLSTEMIRETKAWAEVVEKSYCRHRLFGLSPDDRVWERCLPRPVVVERKFYRSRHAQEVTVV